MNIRSGLLAAVALAALAPPTAFAQTSTITLAFIEGETTAFNQADCKAKKTKSIRYECNYPGTEFMVFLSSGSCPNEPPEGAIMVVNRATVGADGMAGIAAVKAEDVSKECPDGTTSSMRLCAVAGIESYSYYGGSTTWQVYDRAELTMTYDSEPPTAPKLVEAVGGENSIHLTWEGASDVDDWIACYEKVGEPVSDTEVTCGVGTETSALEEDPGKDAYRSASDGGVEDDAGAEESEDAGVTEDAGETEDAGVTEDAGMKDDAGETEDAGGLTPAEQLAACPLQFRFSEGSARKGAITKLVNAQPYRVKLFAMDSAGNLSQPSAPLTATPQQVYDFYERYRCQGGTEEGGFGCSAGAGVTLVPLAGLIVVGLLRRRNTRSAE
ncbi:MAG: hypothetical protein ACOX6T_14500 [Myxococcales bacterium]|jgi:hypothetical protein